MKVKIIISVMFVLVVLTHSCKKKPDPTPVVEQPEYVTTGLINGSNLNISVGLGGYIMKSYQKYDTSNAVAEFCCDLQKENCNPCPNSIHITLRNSEQTLQNQSINSNIAFTQSNYPLRSVTGSAFHFNLQFNAQTSNATVSNYKWFFGDGQVSNQANILHTYSNPGIYSPGLIVFYANGCSDTLINKISIAVPGSICKARYTITSAGGTTFNFNNQSIGIGSLNYEWNFGDGTKSTLQNPTHTYPIGASKYNVNLLVTDASKHVAEYRQHILVSNNLGCLANFPFPQITEVANPKALANATVEWVDSNGINYSSLGGLQPEGSYFKIISIKSLPDTPAGMHPKKLSLQLVAGFTMRNKIFLILRT